MWGSDKECQIISIMTDFYVRLTKGDFLDFVEERIFWDRGSMLIINKGMLRGHPCRMPRLTEMELER